MTNQTTKSPELLFALTVRDDQDGSITVARRKDGVVIRDPFTRIRNVAVGYNTVLSGNFAHAGEITHEARQRQELAIAGQIDRLWAQTPRAKLGILDFAEALLPAAMDARRSQPARWTAFEETIPPALDPTDHDVEYELRVQDHLTDMAVFCRSTWAIPWAFPTFPGSRYFALGDGTYTDFVGYPMTGEPEYEKHQLQRENDRVLVPILSAARAVLVQAGYFDAKWEPGHEEQHWRPGMWDQGRLRRADVERKIRSEIAEARRLAAQCGEDGETSQVYAMACPVVRRSGEPWVNRETWGLFAGICASLGVPIVLWMAFGDRAQVIRFREWCTEVGVSLPGEIWLPEPAADNRPAPATVIVDRNSDLASEGGNG